MFDVTKCRLCASVSPLTDLIDIKTHTDLNPSLEYKIYYCFQIQIVDEDKLPTTICSNCYQKLDSVYEFIEQVHEAQNVLQRSLDTHTMVPDGDSLLEDLKLEFYLDTDDNEIDNESTLNTPDILENDLSAVKEEIQSIENNVSDIDDTFIVKRKTRSQARLRSKRMESDRITEDRSALLIKIFREWKNYKWKCDDCPHEFSSVKELRAHYKEIHRKPPLYKCIECSKVLDNYGGFQKHVRNHRNQHKFCCELCGKFSYNKEHHERHKATHSKERKYMCSTCGNHFKTPGSLKIHERLHLPPELREQFECDICQKKLASQASLWSHKKLHSGVKEHTCDICGKIFAQKTNLTQHVSLHEEGKPFQCDLCPRSFKTARRLKRHTIVHSNVKPHKCDVCGKTFRAKQTLNDHKAIHSDYFPYECEHCKKGFKLKQLLKVHLRQHTGERPYACDECNHRFANWSNYNKHMKSRHGLNMKSPVTQLIHEQQQQMK